MTSFALSAPLLHMQAVSKQFVLHLQNSTSLSVLQDFDLKLMPGECVRLSGPSGMGKSTVLKLAFGNYRATAGHILVRSTEGEVVDITQANARTVLRLRSQAMGYVSQFLFSGPASSLSMASRAPVRIPFPSRSSVLAKNIHSGNAKSTMSGFERALNP